MVEKKGFSEMQMKILCHPRDKPQKKKNSVLFLVTAAKTTVLGVVQSLLS